MFRNRRRYQVILFGVLLLAGCAGDELTGPDQNQFDPQSTVFAGVTQLTEFEIEMGEMIPVQVAVSDSDHVYVLWKGFNNQNATIVKYSASGTLLQQRSFTTGQLPTGLKWRDDTLHVTFNADGLSTDPVSIRAYNSMLVPGTSIPIDPLTREMESAAPLRVALADNGEIHVSYSSSGATAFADSVRALVNVFDSSGTLQRHIDVDLSDITIAWTDLQIGGVAVASDSTLYAQVLVYTATQQQPQVFMVKHDGSGDHDDTWNLDWALNGGSNFINDNFNPIAFTDQDHLCIPAGSRLQITADETILVAIDTGNPVSRIEWLDVTFAAGGQTFHALTESSSEGTLLPSYSIREFNYDW